ncbi:MAG: hypothetical protein QW607_02330 [Desulfurococcaceae archaeon]
MMNKYTRNYIFMIALTLLLLIIFMIFPTLNELYLILRFIIGLIGLIIIPGLIFANIIFDKEELSITFAIISGLMLQLLNVYILWIIHIFYAPLNFNLSICILTIIEVIFIIVYSYLYNIPLYVNKELLQRDADTVLIINVILYLILAFYWQQYAPSPHSDGAAYMDMARNVVENGVFCSNMLFPVNTWNYVEYSTGMHTHMFGYFAIALFFMIGNVSLLYAKIMLIFSGLLIILLMYKLVRKIFNINVARLAALITALSPELLTHVGLVGGPEIPSALFALYAIHILTSTPPSERKFRKACIGGLSLFISWYAWYFNFFVFVTFLPIIFIYTSLKNNDFRVFNVLLLLGFLSSFIIEWRILLNFTYSRFGVHLPSIFILSILTYLFKFRKSKNTLNLFLYVIIMLYLFFYSLVFSLSYTHEFKKFIYSSIGSENIAVLNIKRDIGIISRAFNINEVTEYWNMYWNGIHKYLGTVVIFMSFMALVRIDKIKETILFISFPLLQAIWWGLFVIIDAFQPRFIILSSLFYFVLSASFIEMLYLYFIKNLNRTNKSIKFKIWKINLSFNMRKIISVTIISFLLTSYLIFTYSVYDEHRKIMEFWNFPRNFGWEPAFQWIKDNTKTTDILLARYGNYWAWFTNRPVVMFTPVIYGSVNFTQLISYIKEFNVKYLIVDYRFYVEYPNLRDLYRSPSPFSGSQIVFHYVNEKGIRVIIYNVTAISYYNATRNENLLPKCKVYLRVNG